MDVVYALNGITFVWNATKATRKEQEYYEN